MMKDEIAVQSKAEVSRRTGDPAAFETLMMPHLRDVARFARSLTRDTVRADDLVQETYLQALHGWHTFDESADAKRWLLAICHHAFLRTARREARYVEAPEDDPELESLATATAHGRAQQMGLLKAAEQMDLKSAVEHALSVIPAHFRGVIVLVDVDGQTYEEAALVLSVPVGTVRSRLFRGRRLLQDLLFEYARDCGLAGVSNPVAPPARHPYAARAAGADQK